MTDDVTRLPVKNKNNRPSLMLVRKTVECYHQQGLFEIDRDSEKCFCRECGGEVSAMFVLEMLMNKESNWMRAHERYKDEMKRLSERSKTKCDHCGKMTRISRR